MLDTRELSEFNRTVLTMPLRCRPASLRAIEICAIQI